MKYLVSTIDNRPHMKYIHRELEKQNEPVKTGIQQEETERTDAALYAVASAL